MRSAAPLSESVPRAWRTPTSAASGTQKTSARLRWLTLSASPYEENANTPPPSSAGSTLPVTSRHSRNAARPFSGRASSARMLYATIGPASSVIGAATSAGPGITVAQARLKPSGA